MAPMPITKPMLCAVMGLSGVPRYHHPSSRIALAAFMSFFLSISKSLWTKSRETRSRPVPTQESAMPSARR